MASNELKRVIDTQLFVPLGSDVTSQLNDVSVKMADTLDIATTENLVLGFLCGRVVFSFKQSFREKYKSLYGNIPDLPAVAYTILELYVVRLALLSETVTNDVKIQISLVTKNAAVLKKGNWQGVLCQEWLSEIFSYADNHKQQTITIKPYNELIDTVVASDSWAEAGLEISQQDIYNQLRSLCVAGMRGEVNAYVMSNEFKSLTSPFSQTYMIVKKMIKEWQWKYIDQSPVSKLNGILGKDAKKRKNLNNIMNDIKTSLPAAQLIKPALKSSVLLRKMYDGKSSEIDNLMFSSLEFGVYLYYELLLETYND